VEIQPPISSTCMSSVPASWARHCCMVAFRGMTVTLQDRSEELIHAGTQASSNLFREAAQGCGASGRAMSRLKMDVRGEGAANADIVIEAIFEDIEAKQALYAELEPRLKAGAVLATNTSSIQIETLCRESSRIQAGSSGIHSSIPWRSCSWWKWSKAQAPAAGRARRAQVHPQIDKLPLPCKSAPGFVVNRILTPYVNEAFFALEAAYRRQ